MHVITMKQNTIAENEYKPKYQGPAIITSSVYNILVLILPPYYLIGSISSNFNRQIEYT